MSFPDPSIPAPALGLYQMSYRGVTFGGVHNEGPYQLGENGIQGLDIPAMTTGDQQRTLDDGEWPGVDLSQGRDIPVDLVVVSNGVSLDNARQTLGACFQAAGATEYPLFVQLPSGTFACMARPRKFNFPVDKSTVQAKATPVAAQLHSTDSHWYSSPSKQASVQLPTAASGGLTIPAVVPWNLTPGGTGGVLDVWNLGMCPMKPVLVIDGPCDTPSITNLSIDGSPTVTFDVVLNDGDTLEVDMEWQTMWLTTAGSTDGSGRGDLEATGSVWWSLQPANGPDGIGAANTILFTSQDDAGAAGTLTVQSADAWPAL